MLFQPGLPLKMWWYYLRSRNTPLSRHLSEFESNKLACDEDNAEALMNQGFEFEQMACSVMSECYRFASFS